MSTEHDEGLAAEGLRLREPAWSDERAARVQAGLAGRRRRRQAQRAGGATVVASCAALLLGVLVRRVSPSDATGDAGLPTLEGARVALRDEASRVRLVAQGPGEVELEVQQGAASFRVERRGARVFRVRAGAVRVQVLGTEFDVERRGAGARVAVREGLVRVFFGARFQDVGAGASGLFEAEAEPTSAARALEAAIGPVAERVDAFDAGASTQGGAGATAVADAEARPLASADPRRASDAFALAVRAADRARREADDAGERSALLVALARATHPHERQLVEHRLGARAEARGASLEAARHFERCFEGAPTGPLGEPCLAAAARAYRRAGDDVAGERARARYLEQFPAGNAAGALRADE